MPRHNAVRWVEALGKPGAWSMSALMVSTAVSTIVFAFGNLPVVTEHPVPTLVANTVLTAVLFGILLLSAQFCSKRVSPAIAGAITLVVLLIGSAGRGAALHAFFSATAIDPGQGVVMRALVSVTVFAPGLLLSVLAVDSISRWRADEAAIRELTDQRERIAESVTQSITERSHDISEFLKAQLEPVLKDLPSVSPEQARRLLQTMVGQIVKPLSASLHDDFPTVTPPSTRTVSVAVREFIALALRGRPLAPVLTGIVFVVTLLPRTLTGSSTLQGVVWAVTLGLTVSAGTWAVNRVSGTLWTRIPTVIHAALLGGALIALGSAVAGVSQLFSPSDLGFGNLHIVGAAATLTLSVLLGGVVNARRYFAQQRDTLLELSQTLEHELRRARQLHWQRNRALGNLLHGSLQATLNAANVRIARATTPEEARAISGDVATEVATVLDQLPAVENDVPDLRVTIQRINDTWEGITELRWEVSEDLLDGLTGAPVASAISEVLIESVFNAVKHQSPELITITLHSENPAEFSLTVSHKGTLPASLTPGLGTRALEYLTLRHSLRESRGEVRFDAVFPGLASDID